MSINTDKVDNISKYYCTVNKLAHYVMTIICTLLVIIVVLNIKAEYMEIAYFVATVIEILTYIMLYKAFKKKEIKIEKISIIRKIWFIVSTIATMCIATSITGILYGAVLVTYE